MRPQQRVIIYRQGLRKKNSNAKSYEDNQTKFAESPEHKACEHCGRYVKIGKSGRLFNHRMGIGINAIQCLNPNLTSWE